jgi:hypothetical protein
MSRISAALAALAVLLSPKTPPRPHILGISHLGLRVSSVAAARAFYEDFLGLRGLRVNGRQHVELIPGLAPDPRVMSASRSTSCTWASSSATCPPA